MSTRQKIIFSHTVLINEHGCPNSYTESKGVIRYQVSGEPAALEISGDRDGLLSLARKIIEVAQCELYGYHKHLDEVEVPGLIIEPGNSEIIIAITDDQPA